MFDYPDQAKQFKEMSDATTFTKAEKPPGMFELISVINHFKEVWLAHFQFSFQAF